MSEFFLSTGETSIEAGQYATLYIYTGITDPLFYPVIAVTPFGAMANVNVNMSTSLVFVGGEWSFRILRSIGDPDASDVGAELQAFFWKIIAVKPIREIGETVSPTVEAPTRWSGGEFSE